MNAKFVEQQEETLKQTNEYQVNTKIEEKPVLKSLSKLRGFSLVKKFYIQRTVSFICLKYQLFRASLYFLAWEEGENWVT